MKKKIIYIFFLFSVSSIIYFSYGTPIVQCQQKTIDNGWEKQLYEMNHLIIKISSVNIINGLYFSKEQSSSLKKYATEFKLAGLPALDTSGSTCAELVGVRRVYLKLLNHLINKEKISDSLKKEVYASRILESEIIKKSILGAQKRGYKDEGCLQCHCSPEYFPSGDISKHETKDFSSEDRAAIDKAHTIGLFGEEGMLKLWFMKDKTDSVLSDGQKYIMKNFRCCLVPPDDLNDPTNIGQAFVSNEWINYFRTIRKLSDNDWLKYKDLFILPLDTLLRATQPEIQSKKIKEILSKAEIIVKNARSLDDIDFELQKESLCIKMKEAFKTATPQPQSAQETDIRKFITAMYLLFPGSDQLYSEMPQ